MGKPRDHNYELCPEGHSYCTRCKSQKPINDFSPKIDGFNGRSSWCKKCVNDYNATRREENSFRSKLNRYGISVTEYLERWNQQGGLCAICRQPETRFLGKKRVLLSVDHNHETGKVRGLLCSVCNFGLGNFRDSISLLSKAQEYLLSTGGEELPSETINPGELSEKRPVSDAMMRSVYGFPKKMQGDDSDFDGLPLFIYQES